MSLLNPAEIPGYTAAVLRERELRDLAFLNLPLPLCGIVVRQFTARHLILLGAMENAFVTRRGVPTITDVFQFLWVVSPEYGVDPDQRGAFWKRLATKLNGTQPLPAIMKYLDDAFYDAPLGTPTPQKLFTSSVAGIVDTLASEYGWTDDLILEMPLARVFQYLRRIRQRTNPQAPMFNRSEKLISDWMNARMRQTANS